MTYSFASSFDRLFKRLPTDRRRRVQLAVNRLIDLLDLGHRPAGLGLKLLRKEIWEFRIGLRDRVVLKLERSSVIFLIVGNHEDVQRDLKRM